MSLKSDIDADLKTAMLAGDKTLVTTLRGLKAAVLNQEVAEGKREQGLSDDEIIKLFQKESKKRLESAELFAQGGNAEKQQAELAEKEIIDQYLPAQMSEAELSALVDQTIVETNASTLQDMGKVIGGVKAKAGASADGALVARLVRERLAQ